MRLLQEHNDSELELIQESVGGKKQLYLNGTFAIAEIPEQEWANLPQESVSTRC